jgi:hypothetical protein
VRARLLQLSGAILVVSGTGTLAHLNVTPLAHGSTGTGSIVVARAGRQPATHSPDSLAAALVSGNPFRFDRRPASVAFDPLGEPPPEAGPSAPRPNLRLLGIVAGADPTAVVEGFPGSDHSRVVRAGDVVAGLRVVRITAASVIIAADDTTWTLSVPEPWR